VRAVLLDAVRGLRARRGRTVLAAGIAFAASLVLGVVVTAAYSLSSGFDRAAQRADLPSVIARFDDRSRDEVDANVRVLPNLAARAYRTEITRIPLAARGHRLDKGVIQAVAGPRRGYAIVAGRDLGARADETVIEAGLAREWGLRPGDRIEVGQLGTVRVVGVALSPDNVSYPLARTARVYLSRRGLERRFGGRLPVNVALLWARDESRTDVLLSQARASASNVRGLRFTTREGVRTLVESAAGLVIALLTAFALVASGLAGVLLAASARSEIQRRLPSIGVRRVLGAAPGAVVALHALEGTLVAALPAAAGLAIGGALAAGPVGGVLETLNELPAPTETNAALLAAAWVVALAVVATTTAWPAWRAARGAPALLLRSGDVHAAGADRRRWPPIPGGAGPTAERRSDVAAAAKRGSGLILLGIRLVAARRARFAALVSVLGAATGVVILLLALASLLTSLRDDPATLGKRYQLTVGLGPDRVPEVEAIPGVRAATPRYEVDAVSATVLGSPLRLIAYPGDHTRFEAPPLVSGRRLDSTGEAEIGAGLADAVGLRVGSTLAVQPAAARELRFRVVGIVRALQDEGRVAYVRPARLAAVLPSLRGPVAIRLDPDANRTEARRRLVELGAEPRDVAGAAGNSAELLDVLASLLRLVAITVALVCLAALVQALALTAAERRGAVATLRAVGADGRALRRLLLGAALAVTLPAALLALLLEAFVLAPGTHRLAAGYAELPLRASALQVALVALGLALLAVAASAWTARRLLREPVIAGLREAEA
jgi:ABC-type antimicrobial peptide transport system permease subunit